MAEMPNEATTTPNLRIMVEDFFAKTIEEAAEKARDEILRNDAWLGEEALAFAFDKPDADPTDPNPWKWVVIEGVNSEVARRLQEGMALRAKAERASRL